MAYTLKDPTLHPNEQITVRNRRPTTLEVTGNIEGSVQTDYLTPGSNVTLQSDGVTWWIIGLYYRPVLIESNIAADVPIGLIETDLGVDFTAPADGIWQITGGFKMEHRNLGNNVPVGGELIFRNDTGGVELDRIPWGMGRTSTDADFYVTIAAQLSTDNVNYNVGETISVWAVNTAGGDLTCITPSGIEYTGPY